MANLPSMLFDEHQLAPSFGYLSDPEWVGPQESNVSMLRKCGWANALPGHVLITQIARDTIAPYEGISACPSEVNLRKIQRTLGVPLRMVRASLIPEPLQRTGSPWFRSRTSCLASGYHGIVYQLRRVGRCPVQGGVLEMACHHCSGRTPYRLNANLLDAPYRCGNYGACYISLLPSPSLWRPLDQKARTAMTRTRLNG
jgi:hypothetical protein